MFYLIYKTFSSLSKKERQIFIGAALILALSLLFIIANSYYSATKEMPADGGIYIEGVVGQPTFINPLISQANETDFDLIETLYSNLLELTEKHQNSGDGKSWTLVLKKDLKWDDGQELTVDDVIFTIKTIQNPDARSALFSNWQGVELEKISDQELRLQLKSPYAFFLENLKFLKVAPQHIFGNIPVSNLKLSQYNLEPVGSGPYKFKDFSTEKDGFIDQLTLIINPFYHKSPPHLEQFIFKFYRNEDDLVKDFNLKKITGFGGLSPKSLSQLKIKNQAINLSLPRYYAIFLNSNISSALQEREVRLALELAVNKRGVVKNIFNGFASVVDGPIPTSLNSYDKTIYQNRSFSLQQASEMLDKAGWLTNPEDDIRYKTVNKVRQKLEFEIIVPQLPFLVEAIDLIKSDWAQIGIKLNPIVVTINDINKEILRTRNYQMLVFGNVLNNNPDVFAFWHSSERFYPGLNLSLFNNKDADKLLEEVRQGINNTDKKTELSKLQALIYQEAPAIFLFNPNYIYVTSEDLKGFNLATIASAAHRFENIEDWHLRTERRFAN